MTATSILRKFDATTVGVAAQAEARRRERVLPVTSLYRWWARRTAAVTNGLIDAAVAFDANGKPLVIVDPFAGGGVIATSALLAGHRVLAQEIDPWATRNLAAMATPGVPGELDVVADALQRRLEAVGDPYATTLDDGTAARMAVTLRVAVCACTCGVELRLFPQALVTRTVRVERPNADAAVWFACKAGHLHSDRLKQHNCPVCSRRVLPRDRYTTGRRVTCFDCGTNHTLSALMSATVRWDVVLVGRTPPEGDTQFSKPSASERGTTGSDAHGSGGLGEISATGETAVLHRHGFDDFAQLYPARQMFVLQQLLECCDSVDGVSDWARQVGRSCVIGAAEFAGLATRWDASYLKPYETVSSHRFALTTLTAEVDPFGQRGRGTIPRRLASAQKATAWLAAAGVNSDVRERQSSARRQAVASGLTVVTGSSSRIPVPDRSVDLVLTDPPYHDDVQYSDLASLFRSWAGDGTGRFAGDVTAPRTNSTAPADEFEDALVSVFRECHRITKDEGHLVMSFANRDVRAWKALIAALDRAGWFFAGFDVVHSENETDHVKNGRRSCALDVIVDLVPAPPSRRYRPSRTPASDEERFCFAVGEGLWGIGRLKRDWSTTLHDRLSAEPFLDRCALPHDGVRSAS